MTLNFLEPVLLEGLAALLWPLCRIGACLMAMFIFGGTTVPVMARALLALALTVCMLPNIPALPPEPLLFSTEGILTTISQVIIGAGIGFMTQFLAQSFIIAGQAVAMQTGLGFASMVDPVSGTNAPVVGQFFSVLTTLVFFALDGHLVFLRLLLLSFTTLPVGPEIFTPQQLSYVFYFGATMFQCALAMAISAICTMLVVNFTFGVMTRAAPQLNVFSMGFSVSMVTGLLVLWYCLTAFMGNFSSAINALLESSCSLIGTSCSGLW